MNTNAVIETSSGDLLRGGACDFENDGQFDSGTESYRTDVPVEFIGKYRGNASQSQMARWSGLVWIQVDQP